MHRLAPPVAEGVGVFFMVLVGGAAAWSAATGAMDGLGVALAFGLVVAALIYALGHLSGAHFNPAITVAFAATGHFPWRRVPEYVLAQAAGAIAAAWLLEAGFGTVMPAVTAVRPGLGTVAAFTVEALATLLLALVIIAVATDARVARGAAGTAIGLTIAANAIAAGGLTGASMNPARSLGPALVAGAWDDAWLYVAAPMAGALAGMAAYTLLRAGTAPRKRDTLGALGPVRLEGEA